MSSFDQFLRERQYIGNVSACTLKWYRNSLKWLPSELPTQADLKEMLVRMREKGLKATGCNCVGRAINSYLHRQSAGNDRKCGPGCQHLRVPKMKEPEMVLPTFTAQQVKTLVRWKPTRKAQKRLHLLILILLDTGCRISEALTLHVRDIDMENLLMTLDGKGRKQRIVPFSFELRKALFRYIAEFKRKPDSLLLASRNETMLGRRVMLRDVKRVCKQLGFDAPVRTLHSFRHSFATNYLRHGGSVFHLQKVLGHSTLEMTRNYANLVTADLQAVHERVSLLHAQ